MSGHDSRVTRPARALALRFTASSGIGFVFLTYLFLQSVDSPGASEIAKAAGLSAALYVIVVLHECGHAGVALAMGLAPVSIRIHALGGDTSYLRSRPSAGREAAIAAAGPGVTLVLALVFRLLQPITSGSMTDLVSFLAAASLLLTLFNLLPGLPLDGGVLVKCAALAVLKDERRATRFAAAIGIALALGLAVFGLWGYYHRGHDKVLLLIAFVLAVTIGFGAYRIWQLYGTTSEQLRPSVLAARSILAQRHESVDETEDSSNVTPPSDDSSNQ